MTRTLLACALLVACGETAPTPTTTPPSTPTTTTTTPNDDAALEAVLRHEIAAGGVKPDETICVRIRGGGDLPAVIAKLQATYATAVDGSTCSGGGFNSVLSPSGDPAAMFDVGPVERSPTGIRVKGGGAHRGGGSAREVEYSLEPDGAGYKVMDEKVLIVN